MKIFTGLVVSAKSLKTVKVAVENLLEHPVYKKHVKRTKNYLVHDELGAKEGQTVHFTASKPYSKLKKWKVIEIVGVKKGKNKNGTT